MKETVSIEPLEKIYTYWQDPASGLDWNCLFVLPPFLSSWHHALESSAQSHILVARQAGEVIGIAPVMINGNTAALIGDSDVSDFGDLIAVPGKEMGFFNALFLHFRQSGIVRLDLGRVRDISSSIPAMFKSAEALGCKVLTEQAEPLLEMPLPGKWDEFLGRLAGKDRHEIRRKLRRLKEAGVISLRAFTEHDEVKEAMDQFIRLFRLNRRDKAEFMDSSREYFFRSLAENLADAGVLRLFFLEINGEPAAAAMCFDYRSTVYLYNNGYDDRYASLSVSLLCKILSIKDSIERGCAHYNFLKGEELYKYHLGGTSEQMHNYSVIL